MAKKKKKMSAAARKKIILATKRRWAAFRKGKDKTTANRGQPPKAATSGRNLPPTLRDHGELANDLYAAAVAVAPEIDEWRAELSVRWGRPVMLTGSGPTLFAYFVDSEEAADALGNIPLGARATKAANPTDRGWAIV